MSKTTTVKFKRDFSPRKKGETAELETKLADYYLSIGVAELPCTGCKDDRPCEKCNENNAAKEPEKKSEEKTHKKKQ